MSESQIVQAQQKIQGAQDAINEAKELLKGILDTVPDCSAFELDSIRAARNELLQVAWGAGTAFAFLREVTDAHNASVVEGPWKR